MSHALYDFHQLAHDIVSQTIDSLDKHDEDASEDLADLISEKYSSIVCEIETSLYLSWLKKYGAYVE